MPDDYVHGRSNLVLYPARREVPDNRRRILTVEGSAAAPGPHLHMKGPYRSRRAPVNQITAQTNCISGL
jgi:hypothetical protein